MEKTNFKNSPIIIDYFKSIVIKNNSQVQQSTKFDIFKQVFTQLLERGFIIDVNACLPETFSDILQFIDYKTINTNSTFYKTVNDVESKSRLEILIDQIFHYQSTYGTNFQGTPYVDNPDYTEMSLIPWNTYTEIKAVSEKEFFSIVTNTLNSGIALNTDLVKDIYEFIISFYKKNSYATKSSYVKSLKNKEMKRLLTSAWNIRPETGIEMIEYIHSFINTPLIIKNKIQINLMKQASHDKRLVSYLTSLNEKEMQILASVFYRYKPFLLALKCNVDLKSIINKLRKYADKYHKPMYHTWSNYVNTIANMNVKDVEDLTISYLNAYPITNYKIITLMNAILLRKQETEIYLHAQNSTNCKLYRVRNGLSYVNIYNCRKGNLYSLTTAYKVLRNYLVSKLSAKKGTISIPENLVLACPTSEKNFIGDIPFGSYLNLGHKDSFIGIYWENKWGARDLDLSALTDNGTRIGWCGDYNNCGVVYSGDMTDATNGATEILYRHVGSNSFNVHVNKYNGSDQARFNIFFGVNDFKNQLNKNQFIDPKWIKFSCTMKFDNNSGETIGRMIGDRFYFINLNTRYGIISKYMVNEKSDGIAYDNIVNSKVLVYDILYRAGFELYNPEVHEKLDYDLSSKQVLIDLFN